MPQAVLETLTWVCACPFQIPYGRKYDKAWLMSAIQNMCSVPVNPVEVRGTGSIPCLGCAGIVAALISLGSPVLGFSNTAHAVGSVLNN